MVSRDGHVRVLPLHVANKIAAGEVVERPASVVKELLENSIDAGAANVRISITQGGRKLIAVQDDGCGMSKDDAVLSLERQATSKILDVDDIERIDTLGFRGEAIPSIASVSRFSITTRRHDSDEGTFLQVNAGQIAEVRAAGCPPGTLVEVRDLFCNVPARRKFLRSYATEESHVKQVFTVHALAHPAIGFSLTVDGRELYRLAPASSLTDRVIDIYGSDFVGDLLPLVSAGTDPIRVTGFIEKPNLATPTRRDQHIFVNGRPASSPSVAYALREAYPHRIGETRPAAIIFIELPPTQVDVNVHPTKREVRFRDNSAVKRAIMSVIDSALCSRTPSESSGTVPIFSGTVPVFSGTVPVEVQPTAPVFAGTVPVSSGTVPMAQHVQPAPQPVRPEPPAPAPIAAELPLAADGKVARPWAWFKFLAQSAAGYLLIETDQGIVTVNPSAARERIAFETLLRRNQEGEEASVCSQELLIPETVQLPPVDAARIRGALKVISDMGFQLEEFGRDTFKIDAVPQLVGSLSPTTILATIARDLSEGGVKSGGARWREELIARSVARSFAGVSTQLSEEMAVRLIEDLCRCRMPYISARGKPVMIFTSNRELERKFDR